VISYARTGVLTEIIEHIFAKFLFHYPEECSLRAGEKGLTYAASLIKVMVIGYNFLVFIPITV
jgi:hypothetical protein